MSKLLTDVELVLSLKGDQGTLHYKTPTMELKLSRDGRTVSGGGTVTLPEPKPWDPNAPAAPGVDYMAIFMKLAPMVMAEIAAQANPPQPGDLQGADGRVGPKCPVCAGAGIVEGETEDDDKDCAFCEGTGVVVRTSTPAGVNPDAFGTSSFK